MNCQLVGCKWCNSVTLRLAAKRYDLDSLADGCSGCLSAAGYLESTNGEAVFTRFCEVKIYI